MPTASSLSFWSSCKEIPGLHPHSSYAYFQSNAGKIGTDQTGWFIVPPVSGSNYLLILLDLDSNSIFFKPILNRTKHSIKMHMPTSSIYSKTEESNLNFTNWTMKPHIYSNNA